jgi:hypothetical protein
MIWFISGRDVLGQEKSQLLLSATQGDHQMNISGKKDGEVSNTSMRSQSIVPEDHIFGYSRWPFYKR